MKKKIKLWSKFLKVLMFWWTNQRVISGWTTTMDKSWKSCSMMRWTRSLSWLIIMSLGFKFKYLSCCYSLPKWHRRWAMNKLLNQMRKMKHQISQIDSTVLFTNYCSKFTLHLLMTILALFSEQWKETNQWQEQQPLSSVSFKWLTWTNATSRQQLCS